MAWHRRDLAKRGFLYDENIRNRGTPATPYPPHVEALRASMLDFSCAVLGCKYDYDEPGELRLELDKIEWQNSHTDAVLIAAKRTQNEANRLCTGGYAEKEWETFFQTQFLKPLDNSTSVLQASSRRASRSNYYYDAFTAAGDALWTEFSDRASACDASDLSFHEKAKCPKPDRALYLPMYNLDNTDGPIIPRVTDPEARQWHLAPNPSLVESFSWTLLKELFASGLRPTPFRVFHKPPKEASLKCYPWLVIEHKKEDSTFSSETDVCCQATNAAACAVQLNRNAATYAVKLAEQAHVPPIPVVTTVGSLVKVWIMHYLDDLCGPSSDYHLYEQARKSCRQGYIMRAIWEGDMTKLDDIVQFQLILENTHTWAMRVFKPLMASYVEQWRFVYCQADICVADMALLRRQQLVDRCRNVIPLVQSYLDDQSGIELNDSGNSKVTPVLMGLLVQQIFASERQILAEEMDRIVTDKLKGLTLSANRVASTTKLAIQSKQTESIDCTQETSNLGSMPVDDDANDGDYADSQPTSYSPDVQPSTTHSDSDSIFKSSTRSNALREAMAPSPSPSPLKLLFTLETPVRNNDSGAKTPLSASTALSDLSETTPTRNKSMGSKSFALVTQTVTRATKSMQTLEIKDSTTSTPQTTPTSSLFTANGRWPAGGLFRTKDDATPQKDSPLPTPAAKVPLKESIFFVKNPVPGGESVAQAARKTPKSLFSIEGATSFGEGHLFANALKENPFKFGTASSNEAAPESSASPLMEQESEQRFSVCKKICKNSRVV